MVKHKPTKNYSYERFSVHLVCLDPTIGTEIKKTRPCIIISPDDINTHLGNVIIAPLTSTIKNWPTRVDIKFKGKSGQIALEQIRTVSKERLIKNLGNIETRTHQKISDILLEMFAI